MYSSARPSYLKTLDTIQNQGLRIALNAYRTSPAASLRVEANERPIDLRHLQLAMMYFTKCHANDSNPARQSTENESHDVRFALRHRFIRPLRHRVQDHLENASIDMQIIHSAPNPLSPPPPPPLLPDAYEPPRYLQLPPWRLQLPKVDIISRVYYTIVYIKQAIYKLRQLPHGVHPPKNALSRCNLYLH